MNVLALSFDASRVLSQSARVGGASIQESRWSFGSEDVDAVDSGDLRERRWIAWLRVYSIDSAGVIMAATDGPTSVSESESSWVEGSIGPGSDGRRFWGGEGFVAGDSVSSSFRFRLASRAARMWGGS